MLFDYLKRLFGAKRSRWDGRRADRVISPQVAEPERPKLPIPPASAKVDVAIGVYGKPYHTALTIASLMKYSSSYINKIYIQKEVRQPYGVNMDVIADTFWEHVLQVYTPKMHMGVKFSSAARLANDDYRKSLRYQFAWEESDQDYIFISHNDCVYEGDIIGEMLERMVRADVTGVGLIGQCWNCPAHTAGLCGHEKFGSYKPDYDEAIRVVTEFASPRTFADKIDKQVPMPFPECRLNEFACLIDLGRSRSETAPLGPVPPFGFFANDVGTEWFRHMVVRGHKFLNWFQMVQHAPFNEFANGFSADRNRAVYDASEARAADYLRAHYPDVFERLHASLCEPSVRAGPDRSAPVEVPPYAVLFRAHFWNDFVQRQLDRLTSKVTTGDVFVLVLDEGVDRALIQHDKDKILLIADEARTSLGLEGHCSLPIDWYHRDYALHVFFKLYPQYEYYVSSEYDAAIGRDLDQMIAEFSENSIDFSALPNEEAIEDWPWTRTCEGSYDRLSLKNWWLNIFIISNAGERVLFEARLAEVRQFKDGMISEMPFSEAAVPTILSLNGRSLVPLSLFGTTDSFGWDRWVSEEQLTDMGEDAFVHPVAPNLTAYPIRTDNQTNT